MATQINKKRVNFPHPLCQIDVPRKIITFKIDTQEFEFDTDDTPTAIIAWFIHVTNVPF